VKREQIEIPKQVLKLSDRTEADPPAPKATPPKQPEWVLNSPTMNYILVATDHIGQIHQEIDDLTLKEYEAAKRTIAAMRGLIAPLAE
jgi:hypothetical protein